MTAPTQDVARSATVFLVGESMASVAVLLGVGLSYPAALGLGLMSYPGENFPVYLSLFLSAVSVGFGAGLLAILGFRSIRARTG